MKKKAIYTSDKIEKLETDEWDFHGVDTQPHLHSLHSYPARFIPQIPNKAITEYTLPGNIVLDPFCGGGTTLLESILLGRPAVGVDNNPVACLVSKAKTALYDQSDVDILNTFYKELDIMLNDKNCVPDIPEYESIDYWFDKRAIIELGKIRACVKTLSGNSFLLALTVFSSIIVRVSYQDSDTRYSRKVYKYEEGTATSLFKTKLKAAIYSVEETLSLPKEKAEVFLEDGRNLSFIGKETIDFIITSPPYLNAYDYHKYHRHRICWIDGDVGFARDNEIGKHDTFTRKGATPDKYFHDMGKCFDEWNKILKLGGRIMIIVGDAIVSGKPVPVADIFIEQFEKIGLGLENRWIRKLDVNKKSFNQGARINQEHILLFKKD